MQTRHTRMLPFSRSVMSDSLQPRGRQPARLLCPRGSPGKNTGVGCHASSRDLPDPGIEPTSPALAAGFFTTEPPGKPHGILLSHERESNNAICNNMDPTRNDHTK